MTDTAPLFAAVALCFLLAEFVKGVIGLGLPTVAVGILGLMLPPAQAAALLVVPAFATNVWQAFAGGRAPPLVRRFWPLFLGIAAGAWAGTAGLLPHAAGWATAALGAALAANALIGLAAVRLSLPAAAERWLAAPVGAATGLVAAVTGVFVIPSVPYLQALRLEKEDLVPALGLLFSVAALSLAGGLAGHGMMDVPTAAASAAALLPAVAGMVAGQHVRARVRPATFRLWFHLGLLVLGIHLVLRGLD